ncbi:MAG: sugar ABC transporter permease [Atribacterota bacterium]|nr:sugar ABC transporter permease [Candidatus Atribacteria bacterium]
MTLSRKKELMQYLYLLPVAIVLLIIFAYPYVRTFLYSFYDISFGGAESSFVGFKNFIYLLTSSFFWEALLNSLYWTVGNLIIQLIIPLFLAILLNTRIRGIHLARSLIMLPWIAPTVAVAVCMRWMLLPKIGIVNEILFSLGLMHKQIHFFGTSLTAMPALILLNSWKFLPFGTLMILAALQTIPESVFEAAEVDGVTGIQKFRFITFPLLSSMIWFVGFLAFAWNFNTFDFIWLTTQGGPGTATQTLPVLIYRTAFKTFRLGEASAMSVFIAIFLIILGILYFKVLTPPEKS